MALALLAVLPKVGEPYIVCVAIGVVAFQAAGSRMASVSFHLPTTLLLLMAWMVLSPLWSISPAGSVFSVAKVVAFVVMALAISVGRSLDDLAKLIATVGKWLLGLSWAAAVVWPAVGRTYGDYESGAVEGVFVHRNQFGYMSVLFGIALAVLPWLSHRSANCRKPSWAASWAWIAVAVAGVLASESRTGWLMALVALGVAVALVGVRLLSHARGLAARTLGIVLLLSVPTAALTYSSVALAIGRDATLTGRTAAWSPIWQSVLDAPVTGYGWGAVWPSSDLAEQIFVLAGYPFPNAHNAYLDVALQLGFVGLVLAAGFLISTAARALRQFASSPTPEIGWMIVTLVMMLGYSFTESFAFTNFSFVLIVMMSVALIDQARNPLRRKPIT